MQQRVNRDAPLKATSDMTQVWARLNPAATDSTPKETAYTPAASRSRS